eukprot:5471426-Amphidinium_carterae.3
MHEMLKLWTSIAISFSDYTLFEHDGTSHSSMLLNMRKRLYSGQQNGSIRWLRTPEPGAANSLQ